MPTPIPTTPIRWVPPRSLYTPAGWNHALGATRNPAVGYQRGDGAVPVTTRDGGVTRVLFPMADVWQAVPAEPNGRILARNGLVAVALTGQVDYWGPPDGAPTFTAPAGQWWWPIGGYSLGADMPPVLWGANWAAGPGFGTRTAIVAHEIDPTGPHLITTVTIGLDPAWTWGAPALDWDTGIVHTVGYLHGTGHQLAAAPAHLITDPGAWTVTPLTIQAGPFTAPRLHVHGPGAVLSAKILPSAPNLPFPETPEVARWWSPTGPAGPYTRVSDALLDTRRPGVRTYAAGLTVLPYVGLVVQHSSNGDPAEVDPDAYGPTISPCAPLVTP